MTTATIVLLIDKQKGFALKDLTAEQGGSLYVAGAEKTSEATANFMRHLSGATIVLSQDFHPHDHISFASNHKGVSPFEDIYLKRGDDGIYRAIAAVTEKDEAGNPKVIKTVTTDDRGYVTGICGEDARAELLKGSLLQTLWLDHCKQGTESALFVEEVMGELPPKLNKVLRHHTSDYVLQDIDDRGNNFYVIRKGMSSDVDSYAIATENGGVGTTAAPIIFSQIAAKFKADGVTAANIVIGGDATNFCTEFSHRDVYTYLVPELGACGIRTKVQFLTDISSGIPVSKLDGTWPDLAHALHRMAAYGTTTTTTDDFTRQNLTGHANPVPQSAPHA